MSRCKHVGTIRTRTQNPRDDAETKANNALTAYHQLAHSVFRNSRISLHLREQLANSLCSSRLKFGVETWLCTTPAATAQIHNVRMRIGRGLIGQSRFSSFDNTTDAEVLDELRWLPTDLLLLKGRLSPLAKLYKGGSKQWRALRRVASGAMETLLDDMRLVREASNALRRMPDPFHQPEPWMNLLEIKYEWSKALRQLDVKCSRPKKSEGARYMSDDQLMANPQAFVCMLCPNDKRRCCNSAGALISHQHRSHGYKNPFRRATVDDSFPACGKTFGTRAKALDHIAYRAKRCRQAFLNGSIHWASEDQTALAGENDRKEAAKLGSQGWAQLRGFRGK